MIVRRRTYDWYEMTRTKRGKGRPKKQAKRKASSKAGEQSRAQGGGLATSQAWTSIKRKNWKILIDCNDTDVPNRLSLFGLPAEIRNQIYEYLFPARRVDIKKPSYRNTNFISRNSPAWSLVLQAVSVGRIEVSTNPNPGLALLSTCRRSYEEGRWYYYRNSIFFLAPGEIANTIDLAKVVQLANLELITSIGIRFDAADLGVKEYQLLVRLHASTRVTGANVIVLHRHLFTATLLLRRVWYKKLGWIYQNPSRSLQVIRLENSYSTMVISLDAFLRRCSLADFARIRGYPGDPEMRAYLMETSRRVGVDLIDSVERYTP